MAYRHEKKIFYSNFNFLNIISPIAVYLIKPNRGHCYFEKLADFAVLRFFLFYLHSNK